MCVPIDHRRLPDYVTEKVYNGLQSGTLPVYWGPENIDDFVPKNSIVKVSVGKFMVALARDSLLDGRNLGCFDAPRFLFLWHERGGTHGSFTPAAVLGVRRAGLCVGYLMAQHDLGRVRGTADDISACLGYYRRERRKIRLTEKVKSWARATT